MPYFDKRASGLLLHITSLPSRFGIGDLGPEAKDFTEFLYQSNQRYWQLLPTNPVQAETSYSPYNSTSSIAGNHWLISPELLSEEGYISASDLKSFELSNDDKVNFGKALPNKSKLLAKAYANFSKQKQEPYDAFCDREAHWLDDYALYVVLKEHLSKPWYEWPGEYKLRNLKSLMKFAQEKATDIHYAKWLQYIFFKQWKSFKSYCNDLNIKLIGDLPFYINYDSVDVWSKQEIFSLNEDGSMKSVAGVPPDYFNEDGQLWGMPIYCWNVLKEQNYDWWIKRIRKNLECVDVIRLDHFRAFAGYWDVPSNEKTAKKGSWKKGPGEDLLSVLKQTFGTLPFIAEDLGEITPDVYTLRDKFELPGMKVLQFAFGENVSANEHSPHNYESNFFVYTGTHDNNTTRGWFREEFKKEYYKQISDYTGIPVTEKNIHEIFYRLAASSVAVVCIVPVQDILGLGEEGRMNVPASTEANWIWRMRPEMLTDVHKTMLKNATILYNRN